MAGKLYTLTLCSTLYVFCLILATMKLDRLRRILKRLKKVVIAYSGGLDSTFLLKMAVDTLGKDNVIAVTARSATYPASEYREARKLARWIGAGLITIRTDELEMKDFRRNPVNRCYYCKKELFRKLDALKKRYKMSRALIRHKPTSMVKPGVDLMKKLFSFIMA